MQLQGKVALVTGGSMGIGKGIALGLAAAGARVAILGRSRERLQPVVDLIQSRGGAALAVVGDVGVAADAQRTVAEVEAAYGRLDILVNNAGLHDVEMSGFAATDLAVLSQVVHTNFLGVIHMAHAAAPFIRRSGGGSIVNIASTAGMGPGNPAQPVYAASKAAVIHLTQSLAGVLGPEIRVNAVSPSTTLTKTSEEERTPEELAEIESFSKLMAAQRIGYPEDVSAVVNWIISAEAGFVSGANVTVHGGGRAFR